MKSHHCQKRDTNEADIVKSLRKRGCYVCRLNKFDLLVGHKGVWYPMEVKDGHDKKLTLSQMQLVMDLKNRAPFFVVTSVDEALNIVFGKE